MAQKIAIIGGGLIGLASAWRLLKAGYRVTIFEKGTLGQQASYAAAGMLAPQVEAEAGEEKLTELLIQAKSYWSEFLAALKADGINDVGYRSEGTYLIALNNDEQAYLKRQYAYHQKFGLQTEWLSGYQLQKRLPHLSRRSVAGIFSPTDHQVDNRLLIEQLIKILRKQGADIREHSEIEYKTLQFYDILSSYDTVVLASGAWPLLPELQTEIRPIKGQMLSIQMPPDRLLVQHVIWGSRLYMVPRQQGNLLIGATVEEQGYDTTITAGGLRQLLNDAVAILPDLEEYPVTETWAGLRPGSSNDAPILKYSKQYDNVLLAMGHYRNGVLLAPWTSQKVLEIIAK